MRYLCVVLGLLGASMYVAGVHVVRRWIWISENGQSADATVLGVRMAWFQPKILSEDPIYVRSPTSPAYVIRYRYHDQLGDSYEGHSRYFSMTGAMPKPGDHGLARFDPQHPAKSIWIQEP